MTRGLTLALLAAVIAGCSDSKPGNAVTACSQQQLVPAPAKTDILFVVDDSGSMEPKQEKLGNNFQAFIDKLTSSPVKNDVRIGITTTSVYDYRSSFTTQFGINAACPASAPSVNQGHEYPAGSLVRVTGPHDYGLPCQQEQFTDDSAPPPRVLLPDSLTLVSDFVNNIYVGSSGSSKEQGLEAMRLALRERLSDKNQGFLRPGAQLAVIIVSDADDCSDPEQLKTSINPPTCTDYDVHNYVDFLNGQLGGEARRVFVAVVGAVSATDHLPQACDSGETIDPTHFRYGAFVNALGSSALIDSVCQDDFHDTLVRIAGVIDPGQLMPLSGAPADWRLLTVTVMKANGTRVPCQVGLDAADATGTALYQPPTDTNPPRIRFTGDCTLQQGDAVDVKLLCAG